MGTFYFHVKTPAGLWRNDIGLDFLSTEAAYLGAYEAIPELAAEMLNEGIDPMKCELVIETESGQHLLSVPFSERLR